MGKQQQQQFDGWSREEIANHANNLEAQMAEMMQRIGNVEQKTQAIGEETKFLGSENDKSTSTMTRRGVSAIAKFCTDAMTEMGEIRKIFSAAKTNARGQEGKEIDGAGETRLRKAANKWGQMRGDAGKRRDDFRDNVIEGVNTVIDTRASAKLNARAGMQQARPEGIAANIGHAAGNTRGTVERMGDSAIAAATQAKDNLKEARKTAKERAELGESQEKLGADASMAERVGQKMGAARGALNRKVRNVMHAGVDGAKGRADRIQEERAAAAASKSGGAPTR